MSLKRYFERHFSTILNMFPFWWFLKPTNPLGTVGLPGSIPGDSATVTLFMSQRSPIQRLQKVTFSPSQTDHKELPGKKMSFVVIFTALGTWKPRFFLGNMPMVFKPNKKTHQNPRMPSPRPQELQHPHISSITDLMEEPKRLLKRTASPGPLWKYGQPPKEEIFGKFLVDFGWFWEIFWKLFCGDLIRFGFYHVLPQNLGNGVFFLHLQFGKLEL